MTSAAPSEAAGLYLHIPFCSAICPYCDFAVRVGRRERRARFVETLRREIAQESERAGDFAASGFDTVYFGGGTPSILEPDDLRRVLDAVRAGFPVRSEARLFLEANPEDVTADSLAAWRGLGVSFLSLGVQSFADQDLEFLGRRHSSVQARRCVELARSAGFDTVSIDLIYGLPGQDPGHWRQTLRAAVALAPDHLSCYELEVHRRTTFGKRRARGELRELSEAAQAELFLLTHRFLSDAGYPAYEVSNFARGTGHRSLHNRKYWRHVPYLGLGPSAHSFVGARRWWNERLLPRYERKVLAGRPAEAGHEVLGREELALEALMLGLRTVDGVDLKLFEQRFGWDLAARNPGRVERLVGEGLLALEEGRLVPTLEGLAVADALAASFEGG